jgi:hypothetical protein
LIIWDLIHCGKILKSIVNIARIWQLAADVEVTDNIVRKEQLVISLGTLDEATSDLQRKMVALRVSGINAASWIVYEVAYSMCFVANTPV